MRRILMGAVAAGMIAAGAAMAADGGAPVGYDLVFRQGTLDGVPGTARLVYARAVPHGAAPGDTGQGSLELALDGAGEARLRLVMEDGERGLGAYPVDVGNPVAMYFMETVVRSMADNAGGSPFYIRNRMKEALARPALTQDVQVAYDGAEIAAQEVTLRPFENDPNAARMQGFGGLEVTVTMSEAVPGWYHGFHAVVPGPDGAAPVYESRLTLDGMEAAQ